MCGKMVVFFVHDVPVEKSIELSANDIGVNSAVTLFMTSLCDGSTKFVLRIKSGCG
jgi:hypothetical protein